MSIVICGNILPLKLEKKIPAASLAGGKYLRNMRQAFETEGYKVKTIMHVALPGAREAFGIYRGDQDHRYILKDKIVIPSVCNYRKQIKELINPGDTAIFYNINYAQWGLIKQLQQKGIKCVLILADHTPPSDCKNRVRSMMAKNDEKELLSFNYAVLLSQNAIRFVRQDCKYQIIEGGLDLCAYKNIAEPQRTDDRKLRFMYAGTMEMVTGVDRLLAAFSTVNADCELVITGKGSLSNLVQQKAKQDPRILFRGYVSDEEYMNLLNSSDVLINPRNMDMIENQNNFPSKVLEYLASGRRTISTKFPGWERFKDNFIFYDNGIKELTELMEREILNSDDAKSYYVKNREKANEYDWHHQVKRICSLVEI